MCSHYSTTAVDLVKSEIVTTDEVKHKRKVISDLKRQIQLTEVKFSQQIQSLVLLSRKFPNRMPWRRTSTKITVSKGNTTSKLKPFGA